MTVRVIPGEISATDATVRSVIPTSIQPKWPPLERVAETIATPRRRFPAHGHSGAEVLTYIVEGSGLYSYGNQPVEPVASGSIHLLTAPSGVAHAINPGKGQTLRWLAVLVTLPPSSDSTVRLQSSQALDGAVGADGTRVRALVGPGSPIRSTAGLEVYDLSFVEDGTTFRKVGHTVRAVAYALAGAGSVDGRPVEVGEAALVEDASGVAIQGRAGFRLALVQVPRPS